MSQSSLLNESQRQQFHDDGFLIARGMYSPEQMARITGWTEEVVRLPELPGKHMVYYEDSLTQPDTRVLSRIENFCPFHAGFDELLCSGAALATVSALFGETAVLFKEKINFKLPGSDGFKAHQDVQAGWDEFAPLHITLLLSIDASDEKNGCLQIAPKQHQKGLLGPMWEPLPDPLPGVDYQSCPTAPGDVILFDSFIPHRSFPNQTAHPRRILYVTYNAASAGDHREAYYAAKRQNFPPDCEREPGKNYAFKV